MRNHETYKSRKKKVLKKKKNLELRIVCIIQFHYLQYKLYKYRSGPIPFDQPGPKWPRFKTRQNIGGGGGGGGGRGVVPFD